MGTLQGVGIYYSLVVELSMGPLQGVEIHFELYKVSLDLINKNRVII